MMSPELTVVVFGQAKQDWLKTFLELPEGIPSYDTFRRVFCAIDPHHFLDCFVKWIQGICPTLKDETVSIVWKGLTPCIERWRFDSLHRQRMGIGKRPGLGASQSKRQVQRDYRDP